MSSLRLALKQSLQDATTPTTGGGAGGTTGTTTTTGGTTTTTTTTSNINQDGTTVTNSIVNTKITTNIDRLSIKARMKASRNQSHNDDNNDNDNQSISSEENEASLNDLDEPTDDDMDDDEDEDSINNNNHRDDRRTSNTNTGNTSSTTSQHQHQQKRHTTGGSSKNAAAHTIQKQYRNSKKKKHIVTTKRNDSSSNHAIPSTITSSSTTSIGRSKKKNSITKKMLSIKDKKKRGNINNKVMNRHDVATTDDDDDNEDDQHDNDSNSNSSSNNTDESTNTTSSWTVTPPTQEIIQHMQSLNIQQCQQHVCVGLRVKVLFDHPKPNQWYGGYIQKVIDNINNNSNNNNIGENINDNSNNNNNTHRCRIKIHYDDGTTEVTNFPDRKKKHTSSSISISILPPPQQQQDTVIIDAQNNGQHPISTLHIAQFYIPSSLSSSSLPSTKQVNNDHDITDKNDSKDNHSTDIRIESSNPTDVPPSTVELKPAPIKGNINDDAQDSQSVLLTTTAQQIEQHHQDDDKDEIQMNESISSQPISNNDNIQPTTTPSNDASLPPSSSSFPVEVLDNQTTIEVLPSSSSDLNHNENDDDDVNIRHPIDTSTSVTIPIPTETPITTSIQSTIVNVVDNSNNSNNDTKNNSSNNENENAVFMDTDHSNTSVKFSTDSNNNEVDNVSSKIPNSIRNEAKVDIEMKQQNDIDLEMETNVDQPTLQDHVPDEATNNEPTEQQQQQQSESIVEPSSSSSYILKENEINPISNDQNIHGSNNDKPSTEINVQNIDETIVEQNDSNKEDNIVIDMENDTVVEQQSKDDNMTTSKEENDRDNSIDATKHIIDDSNVAPETVKVDSKVHLESDNTVQQSNEVRIPSSVDKDETHVPIDTTITEIDDQNNVSKSATSDMAIDDPKNEVTTTTTDTILPLFASDTMEHDASISNAIVDDNTTNPLQPQEKGIDSIVEEPTIVVSDDIMTLPAHVAETTTTGMETDAIDEVVKKSDLEGTTIHPDSNKELEHTLNPPTSEATVVKETVTSNVNTATVTDDKVSIDKVQSSVSNVEISSQPSTISKSIDDLNISKNSLDSHAHVDSSTSISNKRTSSDITDLSTEERPKKKLTIRIPIHKIKAKINQTDSDPSTSTTVTTPIISDKKKGTEVESYKPTLDGTDSKVTIANISKNDDDTQTVTSPRQLKKLQKLERKKKKLLLESAESKKEGVVSSGTNNTESISKVKKDRMSIDVSNNNVVQSVPSLDNSVYTPTNESNNDMDYLLDGTIRSERRAAQQANERIVAKSETILPKSSSLSTTTTTTASEDVIGKKKKKGVRRKEMDGDVVRKSSSKENENELDDSQWVQCDKCGKWRIIPNSVVQLLPKQWYCTDNIYDPKHNSCDAPEQTDKDVAREKKRRLKKKQRLLKAAEEAAAAALTSAEGIGQKQETSIVEGINQTTSALQRSPKTPRETIDDIEKPTKQPKRLSSMDESKIPELPSMDARPGKQKEKKIPSLSGKRGRSVESMDKLVTVQEESIPAVVVGTDTAKPRGRGRPRRNNTNSNNNMNSNTKESNPTAIGGGSTQQQQSSSSALDDGENLEWVQCEKCDKWRKLPPHVSADDLPDVWTCNMNTWNPSSASCDAPEDKSDGLQDIGVFGTNGSSAGKLTYRHLIFGSTGRKANRPISEKTRAAESIFSLHFDDDDAPTKVLYADSSAYISRGRPNAIQVEENDNISFLELMNHSKLWQELRCIASPPPLSSLQQQQAHVSPNSVSAVGPLNDTLRMNAYTYETLPFDIQEAMKEYVLGFIDTYTLSGDEIVHRIQSSINPSSNTVINSNDGDLNNELIKFGNKQLSMTKNYSNILQQQQQKVAVYCTEPVIITTVCHLVKIGRMECIQKRRISTSNSTNTFSRIPNILYYRRCIQRVTPTINNEVSSLYRNNNNNNEDNNNDDNNDKVDTTTSPTTGNSKEQQQQQHRRLSYPMKLSKPWKHTTITNM